MLRDRGIDTRTQSSETQIGVVEQRDELGFVQVDPVVKVERFGVKDRVERLDERTQGLVVGRSRGPGLEVGARVERARLVGLAPREGCDGDAQRERGQRTGNGHRGLRGSVWDADRSGERREWRTRQRRVRHSS